MENQFKVVSKRDSQVLLDFITFNNRVNHPRVTMHSFIFGFLFLLIPCVSPGLPVAVVVCVILGILFMGMAFFRQYIALARLKKIDEAYKDGQETTYLFDISGLKIYINGQFEKNAGGYRNIHSFWSDERNYYIGMNEDELYLIPKRAFAEGDEKEFQKFIETKSRVDCKWIPFTLKNKINKTIVYIRTQDQLHDKKIAEQRRQKKMEKEQRKKQ